jgi:glycosyltransferase involved in cell wall biosynthesis
MAGAAPRLEAIARANRRLLDELGLPVFVSTPDLLLDVPEATWLPVVIAPAVWASGNSPFQRPRPVVAHAPSSGPVKGSELIDPVLRRLDDERLVEYRRVEHVPHSAMAELYKDADIVVDQLRIANYGVAACEAMAAGRLVVSHVSDFTRGVVRDLTGWDLPIVEADADSLEDVIRRAVADRDRSRARAARGPDFVSEIHDGRRSAGLLRAFLT